MPELRKNLARWDRTPSLRDRLYGDPRYEEPDKEQSSPNGWFAGRPIIGQDTPINGGVYLGALPREAIVVDDARDTKRYNRVFEAALRSIYSTVEEEPDLPIEAKVLVPVYTEVRRALPYDNMGVDTLTRGMRDEKINLSEFMRGRAGVCRHQALLTGYVLERLRYDGELMAEDSVSIDRNSVPGRGGHAWARFTASDGTPYIIDPAQSRVDRLDRLDDLGWDYRRPEDWAD